MSNHVHSGDDVSDMVDQRHVGIILHIERGIATVEWENGWRSQLRANRLEYRGRSVLFPAITAKTIMVD